MDANDLYNHRDDATVLGIAALGWCNRDLRSARVGSAVILAGGAAFWTFGAVWNVLAVAAVR